MICSFNGCGYRGVIFWFLGRVKFSYCKKHQKYPKRILRKIDRWILNDD